MIILDTNVLSALMRSTPEPEVVSWLDQQPRTSIWITSITVLEVEFGLQIMPIGKRRSSLTKGFQALVHMIGDRVAAFDGAAAEQAAALMALRRKVGRPADLRDTMIAGIVLAHNATLATRNTAHFEDVPASVINPWFV